MSLHGLKACQVNVMEVGNYTVIFSISSSTGRTMSASRVVVVTPICNTAAGDVLATCMHAVPNVLKSSYYHMINLKRYYLELDMGPGRGTLVDTTLIVLIDEKTIVVDNIVDAMPTNLICIRR